MASPNSEMYSRMAYVGNLPADVTSEEMKQLCSQVGEVVRFIISIDRETQQPKGFGFCEYRDPQLVDAAVELLHHYEYKGASLYVRRATELKRSHRNQSQSNKASVAPKKKKKASSKIKAVDEITRVVSSLSTSEKREILSQIKEFIEKNEKGARDVLSDNPQLAQALLLIQMEFNLVKSQDIQALTQHVSNTVKLPKAQTQQIEHKESNDSNDNNNNDNSNIMISNQNTDKGNNDDNTDVEMHDIVESKTPQEPSQAVVNKTNVTQSESDKVNDERWNSLSEQQRNILRTVQNMTPEQIAKLPENIRKQIHAVQKKFVGK